MFQQRVPLQRNPVSPSRAITRRRYQRYTRYTYLRASHAMKKKNALLKARPNAIFTARFPARGWLKSKVTHRPYKDAFRRFPRSLFFHRTLFSVPRSFRGCISMAAKLQKRARRLFIDASRADEPSN